MTDAYTIDELADCLDVSRRTAYNYTTRGLEVNGLRLILRTVCHKSRRYVTTSDLINWTRRLQLATAGRRQSLKVETILQNLYGGTNAHHLTDHRPTNPATGR